MLAAAHPHYALDPVRNSGVGWPSFSFYRDDRGISEDEHLHGTVAGGDSQKRQQIREGLFGKFFALFDEPTALLERNPHERVDDLRRGGPKIDAVDGAIDGKYFLQSYGRAA